MTKNQIKKQVLKMAQEFVAKMGPVDKLTDAQITNFLVEVWQHGYSAKTTETKKKQNT